MSKIVKAIFLLINNPILLFKRLAIEIRSIWPLPKGFVQKKINGVLFEFDFDYNPLMKVLYLGKYEMQGIEIMKKILRKGDTCIDVGANTGYISAIAAGFVGITGQVHSFEPVPEYFQELQKMATLNPAYQIITNQYALGEEDGSVMINVRGSSNIGWNTVVPGFMNDETRKQSYEVPIRRLDNYIKGKRLDNVTLIKIDVEGFEFPVLKGLKNFLANKETRPFILCEIAPAAYPLLGYSLADLFNYMAEYDYTPFRLDNIKRKIDYSSLKQTTDVLFRSYI